MGSIESHSSYTTLSRMRPPTSPSLRRLLHRIKNQTNTRSFSSTPPPGPSKDTISVSRTQSRLRRLNDRLPRFLRAYTTPLLGAPVTHITSFLILHEITAVVPLFGLVAAFHYGSNNNTWISLSLPDRGGGGSFGTAFDEGVSRFGRWLRKKGWVGEEDVEALSAGRREDGEDTQQGPLLSKQREERAGTRLILEFATAYAITKAFLPVRIVASVWATPWFARRVLVPVTAGVRRVFGSGKKV